jgi:hypothetical protein
MTEIGEDEMAQANTEQGARRPIAPDIMDVEPLGAADHACLQEIKDVLLRHGRLNRFGVTLLHEHFAISHDEILVEECDPANRTLTIRPEKKFPGHNRFQHRNVLGAWRRRRSVGLSGPLSL